MAHGVAGASGTSPAPANCSASATQGEPADANADEPPMLSHPCPCCGGRMIIIETFERGSTPRTRPSTPIRIDTS